MKKAYLNWSGGKDASMALWKCQNSGEWEICSLLTTLSSDYQRVSMHGVREQLLDQQAASTGIPLVKAFLGASASMEAYNSLMEHHLTRFKEAGIESAIFGDIFLEDLRLYRETQLSKVGIEGIFPLWKQESQHLMLDFIKAGFKAVAVCVNAKYLDASFAGREIDENWLADLPGGVDPCGENGEFHTFVYDGPIFKQPILFKPGKVVERFYVPTAKDQSNCYDATRDNATNWDTAFYYKDLLAR
ncbi:ATP-binding protein [Chitinophaga caeni]|uniref:ATP-binding protein n=1 Tax=Chitinophaga caeni TaxID=2029983 RepID=A0A291R0N8_9BACT|nr:diphthine--ammonia ligase [Chitinophaga caeni]ATL49758.1 ATP-binding protein [Chitinophaga caeni]